MLVVDVLVALVRVEGVLDRRGGAGPSSSASGCSSSGVGSSMSIHTSSQSLGQEVGHRGRDRDPRRRRSPSTYDACRDRAHVMVEAIGDGHHDRRGRHRRAARRRRGQRRQQRADGRRRRRRGDPARRRSGPAGGPPGARRPHRLAADRAGGGDRGRRDAGALGDPRRRTGALAARGPHATCWRRATARRCASPTSSARARSPSRPCRPASTAGRSPTPPTSPCAPSPSTPTDVDGRALRAVQRRGARRSSSGRHATSCAAVTGAWTRRPNGSSSPDVGAVLRRHRPDDLDALHAAIEESRDHLRPFMPWADQTRDDTATFLAGADRAVGRRQRVQLPDRRRRRAARCSAAAASTAGSAPTPLEIGYWLRADGHRPRASSRLQRRPSPTPRSALDGIERVEIHCDEANVRSAAVPRRLGYRLDRIETDDVSAPGDARPLDDLGPHTTASLTPFTASHPSVSRRPEGFLRGGPAADTRSAANTRIRGRCLTWAGWGTDMVFGRRTGHEQVTFCHDAVTGLRAIVAIYSTALGPALGGTRFYPTRARPTRSQDVLDLRRAMAYKNALAGLDHGGGKAVIIGDPATDKSPDAAPGLRALRAGPRRALHHGLRRRHVRRGHGRRRRGVRPRHRAQRRRTAAPATPACSPRSACTRACSPPPSTAGTPTALRRPAHRHRRGRQGRQAPRRPRPRRGRRRRRHRRRPGGDRLGARAPPRRRASSTTPTRWCAPTLDVYAPCALGGALDDEVAEALRATHRVRRRQQPARPRPHRQPARRAGHRLLPRLPRQRRRRDPGRRRAARVLLRAGQGQDGGDPRRHAGRARAPPMPRASRRSRRPTASAERADGGRSSGARGSGPAPG